MECFSVWFLTLSISKTWRPTCRFACVQREKLGSHGRVPEIYTNIYHLYMGYIMVFPLMCQIFRFCPTLSTASSSQKKADFFAPDSKGLEVDSRTWKKRKLQKVKCNPSHQDSRKKIGKSEPLWSTCDLWQENKMVVDTVLAYPIPTCWKSSKMPCAEHLDVNFPRCKSFDLVSWQGPPPPMPTPPPRNSRP